MYLILAATLLLPSTFAQATTKASTTSSDTSTPASGVRIEKDSLIERLMLTLEGYVQDAEDTLDMAIKAAPNPSGSYLDQLKLWKDMVNKMELNTQGQTLQSLKQQLELMNSNLISVMIPLSTMSLQPDVMADGHFVMALKHVTSSVNNLKLEMERLWRYIYSILTQMRIPY